MQIILFIISYVQVVENVVRHFVKKVRTLTVAKNSLKVGVRQCDDKPVLSMNKCIKYEKIPSVGVPYNGCT